MANITEDGNLTIILCATPLHGTHLIIFFSALNGILAITAFLGNVLILVAIQKVSSLHSSSKLLFGCLASTDLCVGLITQPLHVAFLTSAEHSENCFYVSILFNTIGVFFSGVSLLTITAISVDRLLALLLGVRYRHVATLRRMQFFVLAFWLCSIAVAVTFFFNFVITILIICILVLLCLVISTLCHVKIYLKLRHHQAHIQDHVHQEQLNGGGIPLNIGRYRKTVSSALWIQITLLTCYLPYSILALSCITSLCTQFIGLRWEAVLSLIMLNSSLNPFLYCWKMREVRRAVNNTVRQFVRYSC